MASPEYRQQTFPAVPPSLSAGDHEMRDYYAGPFALRPPLNQAPYLTPYLGLRARLSQVWINRWTVLLLLVLVRVLFAIANANDMIDDARTEALSACLEVEKVGSAFASMPHYMSQGVNSMAADGISKAVHGLHTMLDLTVTGVEEMVIFYIGMLTNTYLCLITAAVSGSLSAVIGAIESAQGDINTTLTAIGNDIGSVASDVQSGINKLVSGINTVLGESAPTIDFTKQINELKSFTLPTDLDADLTKINASIPTFEDVKNFTDNVISIPFEDLKTLMDQAWGNYTFNGSLFPVPDKQSLGFCSDNNHINTFFDDLKAIAHEAKKVFSAVLVILALLACIPMALIEIRRYAVLQIRARKVKAYATDAMDGVYLITRPYTSEVGRTVANRFGTNKRQILARWFVAYCTSLPALFLLSLALAGLFSCLCQYILLKVITKEVPAITAEIVGFADDVVQSMNNASQKWSTDANTVIMNEGGKLNQDLLGWVNTSTVAMNNTLNAFVDETIHVLNTTFGGTPLYGPITEVFNCLIGLKVKGIEAGLTWVHDHAQVNFPMLPNDTLTISNLLTKTNSPGSDLFSDTQGATQDDVSAAVNKVGNKILAGIRQEALISFMLLLAWFIVFLIGLVSIMIKFYGRGSSRGPIGHEYKTDDLRSSFGSVQEFAPRTATPVPVYSNANSRTPYSHQSNEEELEPEKHGVVTQDTNFSRPNIYQAEPVTYRNEKGGFI